MGANPPRSAEAARKHAAYVAEAQSRIAALDGADLKDLIGLMLPHLASRIGRAQLNCLRLEHFSEDSNEDNRERHRQQLDRYRRLHAACVGLQRLLAGAEHADALAEAVQAWAATLSPEPGSEPLTPAAPTTDRDSCGHVRLTSYTEDGRRYHGCRDCGTTWPLP